MTPLRLTAEDRELCAGLCIEPPESDDNPLAGESIEHAAALMSTPGAFIAVDPSGAETVVVPLSLYEVARERGAELEESRAEVRRLRARVDHARADLRSVLMAALFVVALIATALLRRP